MHRSCEPSDRRLTPLLSFNLTLISELTKVSLPFQRFVYKGNSLVKNMVLVLF